ncbi:LytR/AlgR family response regulator transcription factor [Niabella beijingensis]|uniref:LytR/AlgR family response regulator transcription factor n=1 Tax=Niabella beijingensis TaxID=2872700 RepID=UPI001CBEB0FA|nr:LytTR family DNA-binding domain-containing protein [Niabella beijingensis]MBZ4190591.1 LytTR family DNA-binding domain-containing protein [Niabella beijingensis]
MNCIIIDDEPLAREAIEILIDQTGDLELIGSFNSPGVAADFMGNNTVDLIFLDIQMPGINGIEFARTIPKETFVIFTTAYSEFATDSYEVDAIDYLIKPVKAARFQKAVEKAHTYSKLLAADYFNNNIERITDDFFFVKADRRIFKLYFSNILFIQGLKDYVVMHLENQKVITAMNIKTIYDRLPKEMFVRVSKSYIINVKHINAVDNNTVYIGANEIPIGNIYRDFFFSEFVTKKILGK